MKTRNQLLIDFGMVFNLNPELEDFIAVGQEYPKKQVSDVESVKDTLNLCVRN